MNRTAAIHAIVASAWLDPLVNLERSVRRKLGGSTCLTAMLPNGDGGIVREGTIASRYVRGPVGYALVTPRNVDPRTITRVVYVLGGRGSKASDPLVLGFGEYAQAVVRATRIPFGLLTFDVGESYVHPRNNGEDRLGLLEYDVSALARQLLSPNLAYEAAVGMSMGGYGALLFAERNPRRVRAVGAAGPAIFGSFAEENHAIGDGFDDAAQFARYDITAHAKQLARMPVMIRCGYDDPFLPNVKRFAAACPHADVAYIEHGCHDDNFWSATAYELLRFVVAPAGTKR